MKFLEDEPFSTVTRNFYSLNPQLYMEVFMTKDINRKKVIENMDRHLETSAKNSNFAPKTGSEKVINQ